MTGLTTGELGRGTGLGYDDISRKQAPGMANWDFSGLRLAKVNYKLEEYNSVEKMTKLYDSMLLADPDLLTKFKENREETMKAMLESVKAAWE